MCHFLMSSLAFTKDHVLAPLNVELVLISHMRLQQISLCLSSLNIEHCKCLFGVKSDGKPVLGIIKKFNVLWVNIQALVKNVFLKDQTVG